MPAHVMMATLAPRVMTVSPMMAADTLPAMVGGSLLATALLATAMPVRSGTESFARAATTVKLAMARALEALRVAMGKFATVRTRTATTPARRGTESLARAATTAMATHPVTPRALVAMPDAMMLPATTPVRSGTESFARAATTATTTRPVEILARRATATHPVAPRVLVAMPDALMLPATTPARRGTESLACAAMNATTTHPVVILARAATTVTATHPVEILAHREMAMHPVMARALVAMPDAMMLPATTPAHRGTESLARAAMTATTATATHPVASGPVIRRR